MVDVHGDGSRFPGCPPQRVLNESWPPFPDRVPARDPIAVRVRVVWSRDGPEWADGDAVGWTRELVRVRLGDPRSASSIVWLAAADVRRR